MILSLFAGCGGLDLGFEQAGFRTGLAYDIRPHSIESWNYNRPKSNVGKVADITRLKIDDLDRDYGRSFRPTGVIGGPPCQSFTNANSSKKDNDPREKLVGTFFSLALKIHKQRSPLDFIMMENVPELGRTKYGPILARQVSRLNKAGFNVTWDVLDAYDYGVAQHRKRLILVAYNSNKYGNRNWVAPKPSEQHRTVGDAIRKLGTPTHYSNGLTPEQIAVHPNHWCMAPKSRKFFDGSLSPGVSFGRSFKTLSWDKPSFTVAYGNREVHVHPSGKRRLSVFEAMRLQGFPDSFVLRGTLSSQITQVSEAVPPPLAAIIATQIKKQLRRRQPTLDGDQSSEAMAESV